METVAKSGGSKTRREEPITPLVPVLDPYMWYSAHDVRLRFNLSRGMLADLKRKHADGLAQTRAGDLLRGQAVIEFLRSRRKRTMSSNSIEN